MASRPTAFFVADALGLDFLNTRATPSGKTVEWLEHGEDLLAWLEQAGLVEAATAARMRESALPGELDGVAMQVRELREWFRAFVERHQGAPLAEASLQELAPLNELLERDEAFRAIVIQKPLKSTDSGVFERVMRRRWRSPASLLLPVADAVAEVICTADFTHVKHCEGHQCSLMFLDKTKGHARRWCSMAGCGNRAKQAAHRERLKSREG